MTTPSLDEALRALWSDFYGCAPGATPATVELAKVPLLDLLKQAAALGAARAYEDAAEIADKVSVTDFRKFGMGVYSERIRARAASTGSKP